MSTELAPTTDDFLLKALKAAQDATLAPKAHCHKSPKRWMLIARHVVEDGMNITAFLAQSGATRNNYYDIKRFVETSDDYEQIRGKAALDAASDYEMGVDLERAYTEKMHQKMDADELEIDAKGWAQMQRGQSMKADRFQKFSGAATQHVVVEHVVSQEEYEDKAAELKAKIAKAKAAKEAEVIEIDSTPISEDTISGNFCGFND
jgi:hypothetical protein